MKFPVMTSLSLPFTAVRQHNDRRVTFEMHLDSAQLGLVTTINPLPKKRLYNVAHSQLPLEMGLSFKHTWMTQFEGETDRVLYYRGCCGLFFY